MELTIAILTNDIALIYYLNLDQAADIYAHGTLVKGPHFRVKSWDTACVR